MMPTMELWRVVDLCLSFEKAGLAFWVDGGWGVDALLCEETRNHSDLDLAVDLTNLAFFDRVLRQKGYVREDRIDDPNWNWVFRGPATASVDLHGFTWDEHGNAILGDPACGNMYPAGALEGIGMIGGIKVQCVAAPFVLRFRNGFEPRTIDRLDVAALCNKFGLPAPDQFRTREN